MYTAEVVQKTQETWRWEQWLVLEIDNDQLTASLNPILLQSYQTLLKNSTSTILWSFYIGSKLERWKSSIKLHKSGCKQKSSFALSSIILCNNIEGGFYTTGDNQLSAETGKQLQSTSQRQTCAKKHLFSGHLMLVWSTTAFWIPVETLHMKGTLSKLLRCRSKPAASVSQQNGPASPRQRPTAHHIIHASKAETGLQGFASSTIFTWPHAKWLPLFQAPWQLSIGKLLPQPAEGRKYFPRVHLIPKHRFLHYRNKQTYFSLAKMCWLECSLIWLIKMCWSLVIKD